MSGSATGEWTIFYRRLDEPTVWKTLRYKRSDGVLVSAKTYDDVYKFNRFKEAFEFAKELINWNPKRNLTEMCKDSFNWQIKNPYGFKK